MRQSGLTNQPKSQTTLTPAATQVMCAVIANLSPDSAHPFLHQHPNPSQMSTLLGLGQTATSPCSIVGIHSHLPKSLTLPSKLDSFLERQDLAYKKTHRTPASSNATGRLLLRAINLHSRCESSPRSYKGEQVLNASILRFLA